MDRFLRPDVLVLGGGGVLGQEWMHGVLSGMAAASGVDFRDCEHYVGTSAGSIVSAWLAAGRPPRTPKEPLDASSEPAAPARNGADTRGLLADVLVGAAARGAALAAPLAPVLLRAGAPGGALVRSALLSRGAGGTRNDLDAMEQRIDAMGLRFDGRLRISAVDRISGRRVMFGAPGAPPATVGQAVHASCAIPWVFRPVRIGEREYVDGGAWSPTSIDAAPARRGTVVLCLNPTGRLAADRALRGAASAYSRSSAALEALALRARGATVRLVSPDDAAIDAIGPNLMARGPSAATLAAGHRQGRALAEATVA